MSSSLRLIRETRAAAHTPWVAQVIAESKDLDVLKREAFDTAKREGIAQRHGQRWTWNGDEIGAAWQWHIDEHTCFVIRIH
jgi:hypothetical protein